MPMIMQRTPAYRTLQGWAITVLTEAHAIRECEHHGWMQDRADPHAREAGGLFRSSGSTFRPVS